MSDFAAPVNKGKIKLMPGYDRNYQPSPAQSNNRRPVSRIRLVLQGFLWSIPLGLLLGGGIALFVQFSPQPEIVADVSAPTIVVTTVVPTPSPVQPGPAVLKADEQLPPAEPASSLPTATTQPTATASLVTAAQLEPEIASDDDALKTLIAQMPLADKIGQMLMVGFHGQSLAGSPELPDLISTYHVGGIALLEPNAHDPQQLVQLTSEVQELSMQTGSHLPLFVAINHEGGIVVRITEGVTGFPGNMAIAATGQPKYAYTAAALAAQELRAMGLNMNLAPVLDVNDNPLNPIIGVRSFGEYPALVSILGRETINGFQDNGIVAVAKHFPGHGNTAVDSHVGLPVINKSVVELERVELAPFQMAVESGVEAIMTAHVVVPAWEPTPNLPASLSPHILTSLLRSQMGFEGIIVTDSLGMGAISENWGQAQAAVEAVKAGADIVLSTGPLEAQIAMQEALITAVRNGEITPLRIDESVWRILQVKQKFGLFDRTPHTDLSQVGTAEHQMIADEMALAAITVLKNEAGMIPLPENVRRVLVISPDELPPATSGGPGTLLGQELQQQGLEVTELVYSLIQPESKDTVYRQALELAPENDAVIMGEWELVKRYANWSEQWQENLVRDLSTGDKPILVISWRDPGAILRIPEVSTFIIAYGTTTAQVKAVGKILSGQATSRGTLPMTIELP